MLETEIDDLGDNRLISSSLIELHMKKIDVVKPIDWAVQLVVVIQITKPANDTAISTRPIIPSTGVDHIS